MTTKMNDVPAERTAAQQVWLESARVSEAMARAMSEPLVSDDDYYRMAGWYKECNNTQRRLNEVMNEFIDAVDEGNMTPEERLMAHIVSETGKLHGVFHMPEGRPAVLRHTQSDGTVEDHPVTLTKVTITPTGAYPKLDG